MHPQNRNRLVFWSTIVSCFLSAAGWSALAAAGELRTWADSAGKHKIKATFVSEENGVVTLEKEDGTMLEIELKKLSKADQKYVAQAVKDAGDDPFKPKADDPFKVKPKRGAPSRDKPSEDTAPTGEFRTIQVDSSNAEQLTLATSETWQVDVAETGDLFAVKPKNCPLPKKSNFFEGVKGLAINRVAKKAAVGLIIAPPGQAARSRVLICDLATGKSTPPATSDGPMAPIALHDDGRQIVMRREEFGFGNQDRLEVWMLASGQIAKRLSFIPYADTQGAPRDVLWAEFLDADHLATSSRAGKVVVWSYPEIEPVYTFSLVDGAVPALSPDRKLIGYSNGTEVGLFDVTKREVIAQQAIPEKLQWPYMAFSPSGRRLGCVAFDKVLAWDVATGKLEKVVPCPGMPIHGAIEFPDDGFILANNKFLIDLENQLKFWTYDGQEQVRSVAGWTFFGVTDGEQNPGALVAMQVPQAAAKDLLKKSLTDPNLFVLKAGTTVKLNLTGIPDAAQRENVAKALTERLQKIKCKAGDNGTIELVATMEGPKERQISYSRSGDYKVQEYLGRVRFVFQGQPAWETSGTNVPFVIMLKAGENIGDHLRAREKPDYSFFERVELPQLLQKPVSGQGAGNSLTLGQSRVTTGGLR